MDAVLTFTETRTQRALQLLRGLYEVLPAQGPQLLPLGPGASASAPHGAVAPPTQRCTHSLLHPRPLEASPLQGFTHECAPCARCPRCPTDPVTWLHLRTGLPTSRVVNRGSRRWPRWCCPRRPGGGVPRAPPWGLSSADPILPTYPPLFLLAEQRINANHFQPLPSRYWPLVCDAAGVGTHGVGLSTCTPGRDPAQGMVHVAVVWILGTPSPSMGTWGSPRAMGGSTKTPGGLHMCSASRPHRRVRRTSRLHPRGRKLRSRPGHTGRERRGSSPGHLPKLGAGCQSGPPCVQLALPWSLETDHMTPTPFSLRGGSGHRCPGDHTETPAAEQGWGLDCFKRPRSGALSSLLISIATESSKKLNIVIQPNW